ncbi:MAG TPA: hypothetical protein VIV11_29380, partial [Kofleriaceae bacterium]
DAGTPCSVEHDGGTMRNNIIVNCSDVGIYLNRSRDSHLLSNTLFSTSGIDFRFDTTSGEAVGNLLTGLIRTRDGATMTMSGNLPNIGAALFLSWYRAPLEGDLEPVGDVSSLIGIAPARPDVRDDYCAALRPAGGLTVGALEHSVTPTCDTRRPPIDPSADPTGDGVLGGDAGNDGPPGSGGGCCQAPGRPDMLPLVAVLLLFVRRKRP